MAASDSGAAVTVTDNGIGLPKDNRERLTEPYMTTREKGTGLGLAIVERIVADHGGSLSFADAPEDFSHDTGAQVTLALSDQTVTSGDILVEIGIGEVQEEPNEASGETLPERANS